MRFIKSFSLIIFNYKLNHLDSSTSDQRSYLGVTLHSKLSWSPHIYIYIFNYINSVAANANRTLNFLKHNLISCSSAIKATAYLSYLGPISL